MAAPIARIDPYALVGTTVRERYSVDRFVGVGRYSAVYRGTELETLCPVGLRLIKVRTTLTPSCRRTIVLERLRGLARPMTEVAQQCATFADTIEVGALITAQGRWLPVVAQAWLEGETLEAKLSLERAHGSAPRSLGRAMDMLAPIADALGYAHARGVVHGSLAPRNLFVRDDGLVQALDLAMALALDTIQRKDGALSESPSPVYCFVPSHGAPEQFAAAAAANPMGARARYGEVGPASDVFALALVLTELVTGVAPLGEGDDAQLEAAALESGAPPDAARARARPRRSRRARLRARARRARGQSLRERHLVLGRAARGVARRVARELPAGVERDARVVRAARVRRAGVTSRRSIPSRWCRCRGAPGLRRSRRGSSRGPRPTRSASRRTRPRRTGRRCTR